MIRHINLVGHRVDGDGSGTSTHRDCGGHILGESRCRNECRPQQDGQHKKRICDCATRPTCLGLRGHASGVQSWRLGGFRRGHVASPKDFLGGRAKTCFRFPISTGFRPTTDGWTAVGCNQSERARWSPHFFKCLVYLDRCYSSCSRYVQSHELQFDSTSLPNPELASARQSTRQSSASFVAVFPFCMIHRPALCARCIGGTMNVTWHQAQRRETILCAYRAQRIGIGNVAKKHDGPRIR